MNMNFFSFIFLPETILGRIIASEAFKPTSLKSLQKLNVASVSHKYRAQVRTCDFDGIQPSLADLRKSLRD